MRRSTSSVRIRFWKRENPVVYMYSTKTPAFMHNGKEVILTPRSTTLLKYMKIHFKLTRKLLRIFLLCQTESSTKFTLKLVKFSIR